MKRKYLMYIINVCYALIAIFMVVCAMYPEHMFKGLNPNQEALYAIASIAVLVWMLLIYLSTQYLPNNDNSKKKS